MKQSNEAVYMNATDFDKLAQTILGELLPESFLGPIQGPGTIKIYSDEVVPAGTFFVCEPGLFEVYKNLKLHPWIDKDYTEDQLQKIATGMWESLKNRPIISPTRAIMPTFTEGEMFPTGATFRAESVEYLRSELDFKFRL